MDKLDEVKDIIKNIQSYENEESSIIILSQEQNKALLEYINILETNNGYIKSLKIELLAKDKEIERLNNIINELEKCLEEEKERLARETSNIYEDSFGNANLVNEDIFEEVDKIKNKLQELKGSDKE